MTGPNDFVVSDHSIVPFLADRRVPGPLVDTASLRFETGSLTPAKVLRELEEWDVKAVVDAAASSSSVRLCSAGSEARYRLVDRHDGISIWVRR